MEAGKFEALSLSVAVGALLLRLLFSRDLESSLGADPKVEDFPWESLISISSRSDGLFLRRKPNGLGSSRGL